MRSSSVPHSNVRPSAVMIAVTARLQARVME